MFLLFLSPVTGQAQDTSAVKRTIISFYEQFKNPDIQDPFFLRQHQMAEMPLNHLGLKVIHRPIRSSLPTDAEMKDVRGILTWFVNDHAVLKPDEYCSWVLKHMKRGVKLVILGKFGFISKKSQAMTDKCTQVFNLLGATYDGNEFNNPYFFEITKKEPDMVEFERKLLLTENLTYNQITPINPSVKTYLEIKRTDSADSQSSLIFTSKNGGFAQNSFVIYINKELVKRHWRINPFKFFAEGFGVKNMPIPDTTTVNGKRLFYSHIDGDGIFNVSLIDQKSYSGEIALTEVLEKYNTLPITVSIITGYLEYPEYKSKREIALYKNIFSLKNVEAASHGHAHPLVWAENKLALQVPNYNYTDKFEIQGSVALIRNFLAKNKIEKPVDVFLWTGDCQPTYQQLKITNNFGLMNVNGGDTRFDRRFDSYSFVMPIGIIKNDMIQIYSSNSNENTYTNDWEGPYYGFNLAPETFLNTEKPIRIKPINIYYHFYSAERQAALLALQKTYDYAANQDSFSIFVSEYYKIARSFFDTKIFQHKDGYKIISKGIKTIRFDNEKRNVDLSRSTHVLGYKHFQNSLYVHLDESNEHTIFLTQNSPQKPYIIDASFWINNFKNHKDMIEFSKKGWHKSKVKLGGLVPNRVYQIKTTDEKLFRKSSNKGILNAIFREAENGTGFQSVNIQLAPQ